MSYLYHWDMSTTPLEAARHARDHFSEIIERDEPTIITRHGRAIAAVVPINDWWRYQELEENELRRVVAERRAEADHPGYSLEQVLQETLARDE
jgi:prevent-host-death family protein